MLYNHFLAAPCSQEREPCSQGRAGCLPALRLSLWICISSFQDCFLFRPLISVRGFGRYIYLFLQLSTSCVWNKNTPKVGPGSVAAVVPGSLLQLGFSRTSHPGEAVRKIKGTGDLEADWIFLKIRTCCARVGIKLCCWSKQRVPLQCWAFPHMFLDGFSYLEQPSHLKNSPWPLDPCVARIYTHAWMFLNKRKWRPPAKLLTGVETFKKWCWAGPPVGWEQPLMTCNSPSLYFPISGRVQDEVGWGLE